METALQDILTTCLVEQTARSLLEGNAQGRKKRAGMALENFTLLLSKGFAFWTALPKSQNINVINFSPHNCRQSETAYSHLSHTEKKSPFFPMQVYERYCHLYLNQNLNLKMSLLRSTKTFFSSTVQAQIYSWDFCSPK